MLPGRIIFVCSGNTCRSPMAAALARRMLDEHGGKVTRIEVLSAGTGAWEGQPASEEAINVMKGRGIDISGHQAQNISTVSLGKDDLILTMTRGHKEYVLKKYPQLQGQVYTLKEYAFGQQGDILDPIGKGESFYRKVAGELEEALAEVVERLIAEEAKEGKKVDDGESSFRREQLMRIAIGADHGGFQLKQAIADFLKQEGIDYQDFGTFDETSVDYPDFARDVANAVARGDFSGGILICGTGIGMSIAANKVPGVRAALVHEPYSARMAREHNDANIITMGGRVTGPELAKEIVRAWLGARFSGGRHERRINKIKEMEQC